MARQVAHGIAKEIFDKIEARKGENELKLKTGEEIENRNKQRGQYDFFAVDHKV